MKLFSRAFRKTRKAVGGITEEESGFTVIELTMVIVISLIMLAGMVAILSDAFNLFSTKKDEQAITDSSRRILSSVRRQLRTALFLVNDECDANTLTFYADIDNDEGSAVDVDTYTSTEKVSFYLEDNDVMMAVEEPDGSTVVPATLGSYVTGIQFYYFAWGETPELNPSDPDFANPINAYAGSEINEDVGTVRIILTMQKGPVRRTFYDDVFLRILDRTDD